MCKMNYVLYWHTILLVHRRLCFWPVFCITAAGLVRSLYCGRYWTNACFVLGQLLAQHLDSTGRVTSTLLAKNRASGWSVLCQYETITGERYRTQLMRLSRALREKWPKYEQRHEKVILQHGNARPHVAKPVKTHLETLKWEVLPYSPYSPDIESSDYYLFRSMAHGLADQQFRSYQDIEKWLDSWIKRWTLTVTVFELYQKDGQKL